MHGERPESRRCFEGAVRSSPEARRGLPRQRRLGSLRSLRGPVTGTEEAWVSLMNYLELEFDPESLSSFADVKLPGRMGDPTGVARYSALSTEPLEKWRTAFANPLRKEWARRYLAFIGAERLRTMGYDIAQLRRELDSSPTSADSLLSDLGRTLKDMAKEPIRRAHAQRPHRRPKLSHPWSSAGVVPPGPRLCEVTDRRVQ